MHTQGCIRIFPEPKSHACPPLRFGRRAPLAQKCRTWVNLLQGNIVDCGCFGTLLPDTISWWNISRNCVIIGLLLWVGKEKNNQSFVTNVQQHYSSEKNLICKSGKSSTRGYVPAHVSHRVCGESGVEIIEMMSDNAFKLSDI